MSAMKNWGWLLTGVVWLAWVAVLVRNFFRGTGMIGVGLHAAKWLPRPAGFAIARFLLCAMLLGWLIPLVIGIRGFLLKR